MSTIGPRGKALKQNHDVEPVGCGVLYRALVGCWSEIASSFCPNIRGVLGFVASLLTALSYVHLIFITKNPQVPCPTLSKQEGR